MVRSVNFQSYSADSKVLKVPRSIRGTELRKVVALCACILAVARFPLTTSQEVAENVIDFEQPPLWKNPCNSGKDAATVVEQHVDESGVSQKQILEKVVSSASRALNGLTWKNSWVEDNFQKDFNTFYTDLRTALNPPAYLPSFAETKSGIGKQISSEHLEHLDKTQTLQKTFEWLQRVAVGMEQLVYDQYSQEGPHRKGFYDAYLSLRQVLCEVRDAMFNLNVPKSKEVNREDMPESERKPNNNPDQKIRDATIFGVYVNMLEYTKQAFEHLASQES